MQRTRITRTLCVLCLAVAFTACKNKESEERETLKKNFRTMYDWSGEVDAKAQRIVLKDHLYGIIDTNGNVVVAPAYTEIRACVNGLRLVAKGWNANEHDGYYSGNMNSAAPRTYGVLTDSGKVVIDTKYAAIDGFWRKDGYTIVASQGKVGVCARDGNVVAEAKYDEISNGIQGVSASDVRYADEWQQTRWIRRRDDPKSPPSLFDSTGLVWIRSDRYWGYLSKDGKEFIPPLYSEIELKYRDSHGIIVVKKDGKVGWLNKEGKELAPPVYEEIQSPTAMTDGVVWYKRERKWGLLSAAGKEVTAPMYNEFQYSPPRWVEGYSAVNQGRLFGIISTKGSETEPIAFDEVQIINAKYSIVRQGGLYGLVWTSRPSMLIQPSYERMSPAFGGERFIAQQSDRMFGALSPEGKTIVPFNYSALSSGRDGTFEYYQARRDDLWGFVAADGKEIGQMRWTEQASFVHGLAAVRTKDGLFLVNYKGVEKSVGTVRE